jgi:hypothetical protein
MNLESIRQFLMPAVFDVPYVAGIGAFADKTAVAPESDSTTGPFATWIPAFAGMTGVSRKIESGALNCGTLYGRWMNSITA